MCGALALSFIQRREGVEALPYEVSASHLRCTNPSVTALYAVTAPLSGEPRGRMRFAAFTHLFIAILIPTFRTHP